MDCVSNLNKPAVKGMLENILGKFECGPCSGYDSGAPKDMCRS